MLYSYLNENDNAAAETVTVSGIPNSYQTSGYTVYAYYNSNNGNDVVLQITGGSTTYGVCTANVTTFVVSNGTSAANSVPGDYVQWPGMTALLPLRPA